MKRTYDALNLVQTLHEERMLVKQIFDGDDTSLGRRIYVRASVSIIESELSSLRAMVLDTHKMSIIELSREELAMLLEESYALSPKGEIKVKPHFSSLTSTIRFVLQLSDKVTKPLNPKLVIQVKAVNSAKNSNRDESNLSQNRFDDPCWTSLQKAIKVRHRVTHPKIEEDLRITDEELDYLEEGGNWFFSNVMSLKYSFLAIHKYKSTRIPIEYLRELYSEITQGLSDEFEEYKI